MIHAPLLRPQESPVRGNYLRLQRRCKCGANETKLAGICEECAAKRLQPSLTLGPIDDSYEREADRVADAVLRAPTGGHAITGSIRPLVQRSEADAGHRAGGVPASVHSVLEGSSQPLATQARAYFEPRFGHDFSGVRVHHDAAAADSARAVDAHAYTVGEHIVFGAGRYAPDNAAGRKLLAHELTHVVQAGASQTIRRAPFDFEIKDLPAGAVGDSTQIYFERGATTIPGPEQAKIKGLATPAKQDLTLHGQASEDTPLASQPAEIGARLDAVEAALKAAGHVGARVRVPHPGEGTGDIDYRVRRGVRVIPTPKGAKAAPNPKNPCGTPGSEVAKNPELKQCEKSFDEAFDTVNPGAKEVVDRAEKDVVTTPTAAATAVVNQFFKGVPRADVDANVKAIAAQVRQLRARHRCHTDCDGGCSRPAYNSGQGLGAAGAMMTICPSFVSAGRDFRVDTLIHESSHANPVQRIEDVAYANTRLIEFLLPADSRRNTDSYVLLMRLVHKAGSKSFGPDKPDVLKGMTAAGLGSDTEQTKRAVAWLESWLNYGSFDTSVLYQTIVDSLASPGKKWVTTGTNEFNIQTMNRLALAFAGDFTDPGPDGAARNTPPTETDKTRVAALHDRFKQMYSVVYRNVVTVTRGAAGSGEKWKGQIALPRLMQDVRVEPSFFGLSAIDQVKRLVELMVRTRTDISGGFEAKYVDAIDRIRKHRKLGP